MLPLATGYEVHIISVFINSWFSSEIKVQLSELQDLNFSGTSGKTPSRGTLAMGPLTYVTFSSWDSLNTPLQNMRYFFPLWGIKEWPRLLRGVFVKYILYITQMRINIAQAFNNCLIALYFSSQLQIQLVLYQSMWPQTRPLKMECGDNSWKNWKM